MSDIFIHALSYFLVIMFGAFLKRTGILGETDFKALTKLQLKVTLPCSIIRNYATATLDRSLLLVTLYSFVMGVVMLCFAWVQNAIARDRDNLSFDLVNLSGLNVGSFSLPFVQGYLSPVGLASVSVFDVANSFFCLGGGKSAAQMVKDAGTGRIHFSFRTIARSMSRSVPFLTYVINLFYSLAGFPYPKLLVSVASIGANANVFVCMMMIGIGFKFKLRRRDITHIIRLASARLCIGISLAVVLGIYCLLNAQ